MQDLPRTWKIATVWLLLGLGVFFTFRYFETQRLQTRVMVEHGSLASVVVIRRGSDGHYHWPGRIAGMPVDFLVDTGATRTAIPRALAERAGLPAIGTVQSGTAGGVVQGQLHRADIDLDGGLQVSQLTVISLPDLGDRPLLGMDILGRLRLEQSGQELRITLPSP